MYTFVDQLSSIYRHSLNVTTCSDFSPVAVSKSVVMLTSAGISVLPVLKRVSLTKLFTPSVTV